MRRITTTSDIRIQSGNLSCGWSGRGWRAGHCEGGEGAPGRGDGMGLGDQGEVDLHLPALVHFSRAAVSAGGPAAVGDTNQIGAAKKKK